MNHGFLNGTGSQGRDSHPPTPQDLRDDIAPTTIYIHIDFFQQIQIHSYVYI